jgi:hypothetical protein
VFCARRVHEGKPERETIERYHKKVTNWIKGDLVFIIGSAAIYFLYPRIGVAYSIAFGSIFTAFTIILLLMDVELWTLS